MSIFGSIAAAIFGTAAHAEEAPPSSTPSSSTIAANTPVSAPKSASGEVVAKSPVDVMAVLDKLDDETDEKLDWATSIVDLMKLLKLDSSLAARKQLAKELNFPGDTHDTAKLNVWLHKAVMTKLAENGGVVPKELQH